MPATKTKRKRTKKPKAPPSPVGYLFSKGQRIDMAMLEAVSTATSERKRTTSSGKGQTARVVSLDVLKQTARAECKCEDVRHMARLGLSPLREGMLVGQLIELESGCTKGRWVCPRLDNVRRAYGK